MKKRLITVCILFIIGYTSLSQTRTRHISLEDAITASVSYNDAIRLAETDVKIANTKFQLATASLLPQAGFSYSAFATNNPLSAFGFKLQQGSIREADFNPKLLNNPAATTDFSAKLEIHQPIINVDALYQRKSAARQIEMYRFLFARTREYIRFETEKAYLQLQMTYEENKVLNEALIASKAVYKTSKDYYEQGLIQKSDLLQAELHVMNIEMQLKSSNSTIQDASDRLGVLMGQSAGMIYSIDPMLTAPTQAAGGMELPDERSDFEAMEKGMESYELMIKSSKMSYLPRLNAFASWQMNDKNLFGSNANAYLAGVQLTWNIINGNRTKNAIAQQRLEKDKLSWQLHQQKSEARVQVNQAMRQLSDASFEMKQQQLAIEQAREALRVLQDRYAQGLVKTTDVLVAETQLSQQRIGYVHAVFSYNLAAAALQFLTTTK